MPFNTEKRPFDTKKDIYTFTYVELVWGGYIWKIVAELLLNIYLKKDI